MEVLWFTDAAQFLARAGALLAEDPVRSTVVATAAARSARQQAEGTFDPGELPHWFAAVVDRGSVVGAAMRTHPDPPHAGFVLRMPDAAAGALAAALRRRGEALPAVNGDLRAGRALLTALARGTGAEVSVRMHTRLFELRRVCSPSPVAGRLRRATTGDIGLTARWTVRFLQDAEVQAGRPVPTRDPQVEHEVRRRIDHYWFWEVEGRPVHMSGVNPPAFGVSRIGPVFTPPEHRGHGYATNAVAQLSQRVLDDGVRPCLYTDQANPTSNRIYEAIGYAALGDEGNLVLEPG